MAIVRYDPLSILGQVQQEMNKYFESRYGESPSGDNSSVVTSNWVPTVDIKEEDKRFVLYADLPGIDPKDIEITMDKGVLTIRGERALVNNEDRSNFKRVERAYGNFYRRFSLPDSADENNIQATGKNGVLEITIPKREEVVPRRISVQS